MNEDIFKFCIVKGLTALKQYGCTQSNDSSKVQPVRACARFSFVVDDDDDFKVI